MPPRIVVAQPKVRRVTLQEAEEYVKYFDGLTDQDRANIASKTGGEAALDMYVTCLGMVDFWVFLKLLYARGIGHYMKEVHKPVCRDLTDWRVEQHGALVPVRLAFYVTHRGSCKSQIASIALNIWHLVRDPNERIIIRSYTDKKVVDITQAIMQLMEKNECMLNRYAWCRPAKKGKRNERWNVNYLLFDREDIGVRTASIEAYGLESSATGGHYTKRCYDDLETEQTRGSEVVRTATLDRWKEDAALCEGFSTTLVVGTTHDRDGIMNCAVKGKKMDDLDFGKMNYKLLYHPATVKTAKSAWNISSDAFTLAPDRKLFTLKTPVLPADGALKFHQVRAGFFVKNSQERVTEIREVRDNGVDWVEVNRAFPRRFHDPIDLVVGNEKPWLPNRFTLDSLEESAMDSWSGVSRKSLYEEKIQQGSFFYSCNMDLDPRDPSKTFMSRDQIHLVDLKDAPGPNEPQNWFRSIDLASPKKTKCRTVIMTGFHTQDGVFVRHIAMGELTTMEILLELFLGHLRVMEWGHMLKWTSFERASREEILRENLAMAERDPYEFFRRAGGHIQRIAEKHLREFGVIHLPKKDIPRPPMISKGQRFLSMQPDVQMGKVHIINGIEGQEDLLEDIESATPDAREGFDLLDCLHDLMMYGFPPRTPLKEIQVGRQYDNELEKMELEWLGGLYARYS